MKIKKIENTDVIFTAPSAKAYTLRALVLASLAEGVSVIKNPLLGEDQLNLISCLKNLGIEISKKDNELSVVGNGGNFTPITNTLNCGESGVSMNVLSALSCLVKEDIILTGADGLLLRPIGEVVKGLEQLGGKIHYLNKEEYPPISIQSGHLSGGTAKISGAKTSQYFSAIALISPYAKGISKLICSDDMSEKPYFDITMEMMSIFGVDIINSDYSEIIISPQKYKSAYILVEGDYSSASFFMLAAAICQTKITIQGLNKESKQGDRKMIDYLEKMGCFCTWKNDALTVVGNNLNSVQLNMKDTPDLVPPMSIAAAFAEGTSEFSGIGHLQFKECNRLEAIINELEKMGVKSYFDNDKLFIEGNRKNIKGTTIETYNDHRIAMSFAVAGLVTGNQEISGSKCVAKSFPDFWEEFSIFNK